MKYIFDNHCHVCFPEHIEDTLNGFRKEIRELGISEMGLLACPRTSHAGVDIDILENLKVLYIKQCLDIPVFAYAGFIYHCDDSKYYVNFAKSMIAMGFDGFKTLEQHPRNRKILGKGLSHYSYDQFFDYIGTNGYPMVCHVGDPRCNWDMETATESAKTLGRVYTPEHPTLGQLYTETEEMLEKHPDVKIVLAHFYFMSDDHDRLVRLLERYPNVFLDLTPGTEMYFSFSEAPKLWREFFIKYCDRIILGSDLYGAGYGTNRHMLVRSFLEKNEPFAANVSGDMVTPIHLPAEISNKICFENAHRLVGSVPKPIDKTSIYACCRNIKENHYNELNDMGKENLGQHRTEKSCGK